MGLYRSIGDAEKALRAKDAEIERLRALLRRHDDAAKQDEITGKDATWTKEYLELATDTRHALEQRGGSDAD